MINFSQTVAVLLLMAQNSSSELADPSTVQIGDEVCFEGFIMDQWCIDRYVVDN